MAIVITVAQQKGGSGKTMLAANLAAWLAVGKSTAVLDIDPQQSLVELAPLRTARAPAPPPITLSECPAGGSRASSTGCAASRDRPGRHAAVIDSDARRAIRGADLVVVPVQPARPTCGPPRAR